MPKMTHPSHERPMSVQDAEVAAYKAGGWTLVGAKATPAKAEAGDEPTAVTRKSVAKKAAKKS